MRVCALAADFCTIDLRRDRHVPRKRRLATIDAQTLY
jgi:hypothetical protein